MSKIRIPVGQKQVNCYISRPGEKEARAVIIFHAWWGLNAFTKSLADRISAEGYVALAPDYFQGEVAETIDHAKQLKSHMNRSFTYKIARSSLDYLVGSPFVNPDKVAAIDFSLGCGPALELARSKPEKIRAVVLFYGTGGGKFEAARADFLGHFAEQDQWGANIKKVKALEKRLNQSQGSVDFHIYPQAKHWFFESDRPDSYSQNAAEEAWMRTVDFLTAKL